VQKSTAGNFHSVLSSQARTILGMIASHGIATDDPSA